MTRKPGIGYRKSANQTDLARIVGVTSSTISTAKHDPTFPPFDDQNEAEIYAVCCWWYDNKDNKRTTEEALLTGADTDGLERYRLAKAQREEMKLAEERGQIVKLNDFEEISTALFAPWRRLAEHAKQRGQTEFLDMIDEANTEVLNNLDRMYGHTDTTEPDTLD